MGKILLGIFLVLLVGLGITSYLLYDYVQTDATFCTNCHKQTPHKSSWPEKVHAKVACQTCHPGSLVSNLGALWKSMTGDKKKVGAHGKINQAVCEQCHAKGDRWAGVKATAGHQVHVVKAHIPCVRCHGQTDHLKRPRQEMCVECHRGITVTLAKMGQLHCTSCHKYLAEGTRLVPGRTGCMRCHANDEMRDFAQGVHNNVSCERCHRPHAPRGKTEPVVLRADCVRCHPNAVRQTARLRGVTVVSSPGSALLVPQTPSPKTPTKGASPDGGKPAPSQEKPGSKGKPLGKAGPQPHPHGICRTCHTPHGKRFEAKQKCTLCHADRKPPAHARGHQDCTKCHQPHKWKLLPTRATCGTCHGKVVSATNRAVPKHQICTSCHSPHLKKRPTSQCQKCHGKVVSLVASQHRVHQECGVCHPPHTPPKQAQKACASCHGVKVHPGRVHRECTGCHQPHRLSARKARAMCSTCHASQKTLVSAAARPHNDCATCHRPHADKERIKLPCTTCHTDQAKIPSKAHARCAQCHPSHGVTLKRARISCASCHAPKVKLVSLAKGPHKECKSCHVPHTTLKANVTTCKGCHPVETRRARAKGGSHADCKSCHDFHGPAKKGQVVCARCHGDILQLVTGAGGSKRKGRIPKPHGQCASCHPQHELRPSGPAACAGCHVPQWKSLSSFVDSHPRALTAHGQCTTCHTPHGSPVRKRNCEGCHGKVREKQTLHAVGGHSKCASCHSTHKPGISGRAACESCHKDRKNHVPGATECKGCHQFR